MLKQKQFINKENYDLVPKDYGKEDDKKEEEEGNGVDLEKLEERLRKSELEAKNRGVAPFTNEEPTSDQKKKLPLVAFDTNMNKDREELGDYTSVTDQMQNDYDSCIRAMHISTLTSDKEIKRLSQTNQTYNMIASQFGLHSASERSFKKHKNYSKLSAMSSIY